MQASYNDGTLGALEPFDERKMAELLASPLVDHVKVLKAPGYEEALEQVLKKKPLSAYKSGNGYRKTGNNKKR